MFHVKHFADEEEFMKAFVGRILLLVFLFSCASPVLKPEPEAGFIEEGVADLKEMPQNALFYLKTTSLARLQPQFVRILHESFVRRYFQVWANPPAEEARQGILSYWEHFLKKPYYGENRQKIESARIQELKENAQMHDYPSMNRRAVPISNTALRILPTDKPFFGDFNEAGQGYPFDLLQVSAVWANTPLKALHFSKDRAWVYVQSSYASGWAPASHLAWIDDEQARAAIKGPHVLLAKDGVSLISDEGVFLFQAHLGSLFLLQKENRDSFTVLAPAADAHRNAVMKPVKILKTDAFSGFLTPESEKIAEMANRILGQSYGWGGLYENRDCSAALKDLLSLFGLWLPRNSYYQSRSGIYFSVEGLSNSDKERMILKNGVPFFTLIWLKGHVMLYVGTDAQGRAAVFHNAWGVRTEDSSGRAGRKIIGKTVITSLEPGKELAEVKETLLSRVQGFTLLIPPLAVQEIFSGVEERIQEP